MIETLPSSDLATSLEMALSRPPAAAGRRLRPERELAALLKVERRQLRQALDQLVKKGVLVRRQGSGTFMRRIATYPADVLRRVPLPQTDKLFVTDAEQLPLAPTRVQRQLQLELWSDLHTSDYGNALLRGIMGRVNQLDHRLHVNMLDERFNPDLSPEGLARRLKSNRCDGYLVVEYWGDRFLDALQGENSPVIFYGYSFDPIRHQPIMLEDVDEAAERGVRLLAEQGYTHIAAVAYEHPTRPVLNQRRTDAYARGMYRVGLNYNRSIFVNPGNADVVEKVRNLLAEHHRPDAFFIADDHMLPGICEALKAESLIIGKDIGLITLSNRHSELMPGHEWSRLDFDPELFGELLVDNLVRLLESAGARPVTLSAHARWIPGTTHLKNQ